MVYNPFIFELMLILPQATDILECLNDEESAKRILRPSMDKLGTGVKKCAEKAKEIEKAFDLVIATCSELIIAIGHQMCESMEPRCSGKRYTDSFTR